MAILFPDSVLANNPAGYPVAGVVADGSTNTSITRTDNGTPLVNIANPNAAGMSYNRYSKYNVSTDNLVINNFQGAASISGVSNLGGEVQGNPNFNVAGGRAASLIVNEVTSSAVTNISGYTEIFGTKADLVIANPNGIMIAGGGFINTANLALITGSSHDGLNISNNNGIISNFTIDPKGQILVMERSKNGNDGKVIPLGLDANFTDYTALISRLINIQGSIHGGKDLNILTGNDSAVYNNGNWTVSSNNSNRCQVSGDNCQFPELAIDASYFGAMYAGKISLIANELGMGVKTAANLFASVSDINVSSVGNISYQNLTAPQGSINITTTNLDNVRVNHDVSGYAHRNNNGNDNEDKKLKSAINGGEVNINSVGNINNYGAINAGKVSLSLGDFKNPSVVSNIIGGTIGTKNLIIRANNLNNSANIVAQNINLRANNFTNAGQLEAFSNFNLSNIVNLINLGTIESPNLNLSNITNLINRGNGVRIISGGDLNISNIDNFFNSNGAAIGSDNLNIGANNFTNNNALIVANSYLSIAANSINNTNNNHNPIDNSADSIAFQQGLLAFEGVNLQASHISNDNGYIFSYKNINLTVNESSRHSSLVISNNGGLIDSNNRGVVDADNSIVINFTNLTNNIVANIIGGEIKGKNLVIHADDLNNSADLMAQNDIAITADDFYNSSKIIAENNLTINAKTINNSSSSSLLQSENHLNFNNVSNLTNYGTIQRSQLNFNNF